MNVDDMRSTKAIKRTARTRTYTQKAICAYQRPVVEEQVNAQRLIHLCRGAGGMM
jgi:hypothetical protein